MIFAISTRGAMFFPLDSVFLITSVYFKVFILDLRLGFCQRSWQLNDLCYFHQRYDLLLSIIGWKGVLRLIL